MAETINAKQLRQRLSEIVSRVRRGERFTVLYRSRPAFRLVPLEDHDAIVDAPLEDDPVYEAEALGRSTDGHTSRDHDEMLYG